MLEGFSLKSRLDLILMIIILEMKITLQHIRRRVVGNVLINISPSNIFPSIFHLKYFMKIVRFLFAAVSILIGLITMKQSLRNI